LEEDGLEQFVFSLQLCFRLKLLVVVNIQAPANGIQPVPDQREEHEVSHEQYVDQEQKEVLPVPKAHAVVDPGAVVVHVEHAAVANRAVVAPFGLEDVAHEAVSAASLLGVTKMETPKNRHLPWVRNHRLDERPYKHKEKEVENCELWHQPNVSLNARCKDVDVFTVNEQHYGYHEKHESISNNLARPDWKLSRH